MIKIKLKSNKYKTIKIRSKKIQITHCTTHPNPIDNTVRHYYKYQLSSCFELIKGDITDVLGCRFELFINGDSKGSHLVSGYHGNYSNHNCNIELTSDPVLSMSYE